MKKQDTHTYYPGSGYFDAIELPHDVVMACSHSGPCDDDVERAMALPEVAEQLAKISPEGLRKDLKEYGAWNDVELADHTENLKRILWIACGQIQDELHEQSKNR